MVEVSVVIPVYNGEKFLRECLDSVLAQMDVDLEVIAVDDGSKDGSLSILEEYAAKDSRLRVLSQPNGGAGVARNHGMSVAQGQSLMRTIIVNR